MTSTARDLPLDRPLAFLDLETTGLCIPIDRIVSICIVKIQPPSLLTGKRTSRVGVCDPGINIPAESTAKHGILDEDVRDCGPFRDMAEKIVRFLTGCDLAGFNIEKFDIPLLQCELKRCGRELDLTGRKILDVCCIYKQRQPRDLSACVREYTGEFHHTAHSAGGDCAATIRVLGGMLGRHQDLGGSLEEIIQKHKSDGLGGFQRFVERGGVKYITFGKHAGSTLRGVARESPDYLQWLLKQPDLPEEDRGTVLKALGGR
jgi:DNA polymerase-3 subunit epsilon